jgi:hypothetical protein
MAILPVSLAKLSHVSAHYPKATAACGSPLQGSALGWVLQSFVKFKINFKISFKI